MGVVTIFIKYIYKCIDLTFLALYNLMFLTVVGDYINAMKTTLSFNFLSILSC